MLCNTGIYLIVHIASNRSYVGLTGMPGGFEGRWQQHRLRLDNNTHHNPHLSNAWKKYGEAEFTFSVHTYIPQAGMTEEEFYKLLRKEEARILALFPNNFNAQEAGIGGMRPSIRTRNAVSKANKERNWSKESKEKIRSSHKGVPWSTKQRIAMKKVMENPEIQQKKANSLRGRKHTPEARAKMRATLAKPEVIAKMKAKAQGRKLSEEHKAKIKKALNTPESKAKISAALATRIIKPETRAKLSAAKKAYWNKKKS